MAKTEHETVFSEVGKILTHTRYQAEQYHLRLSAPLTASQAFAGQFIHLQCAPHLQLRRPMSIMNVDKDNGTVDILYFHHGQGTALLATKQKDDCLELLGPIGKAFKRSRYRRRPLLIGGGVGIPPMIFLAKQIKQLGSIHPLVLIGSERPFPFTPIPSKILLPQMPNHVIASMPLLEDWGIPSRLTSLQDHSGCYQGYVTELGKHWLDSINPTEHEEIEIFACGPNAMLEAVALLAEQYNLPCQIAVEEYMGCAVGGCAGCTIPIHSKSGVKMKRVCVDGPVFEAYEVYPPSARHRINQN